MTNAEEMRWLERIREARDLATLDEIGEQLKAMRENEPNVLAVGEFFMRHRFMLQAQLEGE